VYWLLSGEKERGGRGIATVTLACTGALVSGVCSAQTARLSKKSLCMNTKYLQETVLTLETLLGKSYF